MKPFVALVLMTLILIPSAVFAEDLCRITCIDVEEGESFLVQTPHGYTILIDTGNLKTGRIVHETLVERGITDLDYLIITHPHPDHAGGIFTVLPNHPASSIYDNGETLQSDAQAHPYLRWLKQTLRTHEAYRPLAAGDILPIDEVTLSVLWPYPETMKNQMNENSLVLMLEYNAFRMLFMGDATVAVERKIRERGDTLDADILKVGHHGNDDASSEGFLAAVSPQVSIICTDKNNVNGYPKAEILNRLTLLNSETFTTYTHGTIEISTDGRGQFSITPSK